MEVEVCVMVDADGNAVCSMEFDHLNELASDSDMHACRRVIVLKVKVPLPAWTEATIDVPAESNDATVKVS